MITNYTDYTHNKCVQQKTLKIACVIGTKILHTLEHTQFF